MDHDDIVEGVKSTALAAGRAALPMPAKVLAEVIGGGLAMFGESGTDRLKAAVQAEVEEAVFSRLPEVEAKVAALQREGVPINVTDFVRVVEQYVRAWRDAGDAKKRGLLEDAFVRSFDRQLYESGLLSALWERLDRLLYGDLVMLRDLIESMGKQDGRRTVFATHDAGSVTGMGAFHIDNLTREQVLWQNKNWPDAPESVAPTQLGLKLRQLAFAPPGSP